MNMYDTVVQGRILFNGRLVERYICIKEGKISRIKVQEPSGSEYGSIFRMGRRLLLPGALDLHTHMREPGSGRAEDIESGTASAAFGGVCAVVDMPNTDPPTCDIRTFLEKKRQVQEKAHIDMGLNMVLKDDTDPAIYENIKNDPYLAGFKVFMGESTGSLVLNDLSKLGDFAVNIRDSGIYISIHAEDGSLLLTEVGEGKGLLEKHLRRRPAVAEVEAVRKVYRVMDEEAAKVHFLHISSEMGMVEAACGNATIEVTPHHLLLDLKKCVKNLENEALAKVNPPIRTSRDRARLWEGVRSGEVLTVGSDHAPHSMEDKESDEPPSGMPGVETMVPLLLMEVKKRNLELGRFQQLVSEGPARRANLSRRGALKEGFVADMFAVDMDRTRKIRGEELHSRCGWSAFEGMEAIFPDLVMARGELVVEDENLCSRPGRGSGFREI